MKKTKLDPKIVELEEKWRRALADYANLEKRVARERDELGKIINLGLIVKLLEVLDELELALCHQPNEGVKLTREKLVKVLREEGCEEISIVAGAKFDAHKMEALEVSAGKENQVMKILKKGYQFNTKQILRPVGVAVGKGGQDE